MDFPRITLSFIAVAMTAAAHLACAQEGSLIQLEGVVKTQNKYSIIVASGGEDFLVKLNPETQVALKLQRAQFDLEQHKLTITLPISATDGDYDNNEKIVFDLPSKLYLRAYFQHETAQEKAMTPAVKRLVNFDLSSSAAELPNGHHELEISGQLAPGDKPGQLKLDTGDAVHDVLLGNRDAKLLGFSILDLKPYETDVIVTGVREGETVFADKIQFMPIGNAIDRELPGLPRCLFLGDTISFNYQRPLREALDGLVNLHHPPENCRGSNNWPSIRRWLGAFQDPGHEWDVVAFNFGLFDVSTSKENYQANLRQAIELLNKSGAKLVWVTSTPIDYGYNTNNREGALVPVDERATIKHESSEIAGRVPGRLRRQNAWAAEVMAEYPDIAVCDLWKVVKNGENTLYQNWWYNKKTEFSYRESIPLGRNLARSILEASGQSGQDIQPMSAHSMKVEEILAK